MFTELEACRSARFQYRAMFQSMARSNAPWHFHKGSSNVVLLQDDGKKNEALPIILKNVQSMSEQTMINALVVAIRKGE